MFMHHHAIEYQNLCYDLSAKAGNQQTADMLLAFSCSSPPRTSSGAADDRHADLSLEKQGSVTWF
jgi:hypothetical protein